MPPLPAPVTTFSPERAAARAVGGRPTELAAPVSVSDYDPRWPVAYAAHETAIRTALGPAALAVSHVGSTAVPGLPAKDRLDIDLVVADPRDEDAYVPLLAPAGYELKSRDPEWYEHRCLWTANHDVNLHVFGPDCDEYLRHVIFRDHLRTHPRARDAYAAEKRRLAEAHPWDLPAYIAGKGAIVVAILREAGLTSAR